MTLGTELKGVIMNALNRVVLFGRFYIASFFCIYYLSDLVCKTYDLFGRLASNFSYFINFIYKIIYSLTVDSGRNEILRGEGGFDPVTNLRFSNNSNFLGQPVIEKKYHDFKLHALF